MKTKDDRKIVADTLAQIAAEHGGILTPDAVVAHAANENSPLHSMFEWDGQKAAHLHRLDQARAIIRSVRVEITTEKTTVSTVGYIRNPDARQDEQGYVETVKLASDKERARAALIDEFSRAASCLRRARELAIVFDMVGEIDAATETLQLMRTTVEANVEQRQATN
jgi:folylpolyglutamate synthase/dihydropteroate synthase